jgi:hypothetical protein
VGTSLLQFPAVQDALDYALGQLATWQEVPTRVQVAQNALRVLAAELVQNGDAGGVAALTADKQALDGVQAQYVEASPLVGTVFTAARTLQAGGTPDAGAVADAARLAGTMAAGLTTLQQVEQDLADRGANLTPGAGGGLGAIPGWAKWGAIGLGVWWLLRSVLGRRRRTA